MTRRSILAGVGFETEEVRPLTIMKYQVSEEEYACCVDDGKCQAVETPHLHGADFPVTGPSYDDAQAYWLRSQTGQVWVFPSHEQIAFAAEAKFADDGLCVDPDSRNPADYELETRREADRNPLRKNEGASARMSLDWLISLAMYGNGRRPAGAESISRASRPPQSRPAAPT
jgi:formylglycine-generating enzyme required for sulfatase activity